MGHKKLLALLCFLASLSSCALQSNSQGAKKYELAVACYEAKNYREAARLFEEATPFLRGKKEEVAVNFYQAYCSFYQKDYLHSADRFKYFYTTFLRDPRVEEALYMQGYALYLESPDERLDQSTTQQATQVLQAYLDQYPEGSYAEKTRTYLGTLKHKLALKALSSAKLYHQLGQYRATVVTLENFQQDFPQSSLAEEAAYLKADAQYKFSQEEKGAIQKESFMTTIKYCQDFLDFYPESIYVSHIEKNYENSLSFIKKYFKNPTL
jgi:outer membrane protein assembly factor BamD